MALIQLRDRYIPEPKIDLSAFKETDSPEETFLKAKEFLTTKTLEIGISIVKPRCWGKTSLCVRLLSDIPGSYLMCHSYDVMKRVGEHYTLNNNKLLVPVARSLCGQAIHTLIMDDLDNVQTQEAINCLCVIPDFKFFRIWTPR